tara:strand:- start:4 stop:579 length:576 start_codon:yes stop_codon:yes gene_type:complete
MSKTINDYIAFTKKWEGKLSRDISDRASQNPCPTPFNGKSGWHTNVGITYAVWKSEFGTSNDARFFEMNNEDWFRVFKKLYWDGVKGDQYDSFSVAVIVTGMAWGSGASRAGITLQTALNKLGKNVTVDGKIGMKTIEAANSCDETELFDELMRLRIAFFKSIGAVGKENNKFLKGWLNRANDYIKTFRPS